jgi:DNA-directed RNA polymerase subunit F
MEWDTGGEPPSSLPQNRVKNRTSGNKPNKQTYSSTLLSPPKPRNTGASKPPNKPNASKHLTRSSTEISLRGQENNPDISSASLIKYVMDRQEEQIKSILAVQSNTIQDIVDKQQKALQESIVHITNAIPSIVTKVLESILPTIITQVKTTLAQDNSDHSSDNL